LERIEGLLQGRIELGGRRLGPQEPEVIDDPVMQLTVVRPRAREEKERVNEQRQVGHEKDVKRAILLDCLSADTEVV
jgi:hypothetical protein